MHFRDAFPSQRRLINLGLWPGLQSRLPLMILMITVAFGTVFALHTDQAYGKFFEIGFAEEGLRSLVEEQARDYLVVSVSLGVLYVFAVVVACFASLHRLLGPIVPIRRHLEALKNGDYSSRVSLREGDLFLEVEQDLNELSAALEREKRSGA